MVDKKLLIGSTLAGLAALACVQLHARQQKAELQREWGAFTHVLVATRDIPQGSRFTPDMLRDEAVAEKLVPAGAMLAEDRPYLLSGDGAAARRDIPADSHIMNGDIRTSLNASITERIGDERVAMTVPVTPATSVAGFVQPGDRVDIIAARKTDGAGDVRATYALENVEILAVGGQLEKGTVPARRRYDSVTIHVDREQALALTDVLSRYDAWEGGLTLVLHGGR